MRTAFAILAVASTAMAVEYSAQVSDDTDIWAVGAMNDDNVKLTASLVARVTAIESSAPQFRSAGDLALSSMSRLDAIVDEVAALKTTMTTEVTDLKGKLRAAAPRVALARHKDGVIDRAAAIMKAGRDARNKMVEDVNDAKEKAKVVRARVAKTVANAIPKLKKDITSKMEEVLANLPFHFSDDHVEQVVGYRPNEIEKYWDGKKYKSKASNGEVVNRLFYKVLFNGRKPGYWTSGQDEMFLSCHALSVYLFRQDGIERDLRPACNHEGHWNIGGLGQCIKIRSSYFSHCGGSSSGYWRMEQACGGVPEAVLRNTIGYEDNSHNHDRHLVHGGPNSHWWSDPYQTNNFQYVMCTGGNQNFRK